MTEEIYFGDDEVTKQIRDVSLNVQDITTKCFTLSVEYIQKHRELDVLFEMYKNMVLKYGFLLEQYHKFYADLRKINAVITEGDFDIDDLKQEQERVMSEYVKFVTEKIALIDLGYYETMQKDVQSIMEKFVNSGIKTINVQEKEDADIAQQLSQYNDPYLVVPVEGKNKIFKRSESGQYVKFYEINI